MLCFSAGRWISWFRACGWWIEVPPLGMSSKGRGGLELAEEEVRDGLSEMSPPWIMKPGMRRWKGVLLYAPLAQRAMKF